MREIDIKRERYKLKEAIFTKDRDSKRKAKNTKMTERITIRIRNR
mgnify:CR=1 FL=1